jgi:predicted RNA-binding Zn-ribbon protein involved in translation (DUF1610 family)
MKEIMSEKENEPTSNQDGLIKIWRYSDFDCPECGGAAKVLSSAKEPYYWDGDDLECEDCGLKGGVQCDEDGAFDSWDW